MSRVFLFMVSLAVLAVSSLRAAETTVAAEILSREGAVEVSRGAAAWTAARAGEKLQAGDRLRTGENSRALVQLQELGRLRVNERTTLEILPPRGTSKGTISLKNGAVYFFTREQPDNLLIQTPQAIGASRGTEYVVQVLDDSTSRFILIDGLMQVANAAGAVDLAPGEEAAVRGSAAPAKTSVASSTRRVQWWLYYPAVLDWNEAGGATAGGPLAEAWKKYREGNIPAALREFRATPSSSAEKLMHATLLLGAGQVDAAEEALRGVEAPAAEAIRILIQTVRRDDFSQASGFDPSESSASRALARSYEAQGAGSIEGARQWAELSTRLSPGFGFAWIRLAELEFSSGLRKPALQHLDRGLSISPEHAEAEALRGFLHAAEGKKRPAEKSFARAIELDPALGNGWLGRGLMKLKAGDFREGRADLQTAAAMEPQRSLLRSYLAKAFQNEHRFQQAQKELDLAARTDPRDPTPHLYAALLNRDENRINEAIRELETSMALNENRRVYRSQLLLDQDRAVRGASLAAIYQQNGMEEVSRREAASAVTADYANPSAHLFLAQSFNALRDPTRFNLRYETPWLNELLLANLLMPGGSESFQPVSFQEYSRLFEADRVGFNSLSEYRSDGQFREIASQYGNYGGGSYSLDLDYEYHRGVRPNNDLSRIEWYTQMKQQVSPQDAIFLLFKYEDYESGDNFQRYSQAAVRRSFRFREHQHPIIVAGYHHEWSPGNHTLLLAGRLQDVQEFEDRAVNELILTRDGAGNVVATGVVPMDVQLHTEFETYTFEANQILQRRDHTFVFGGRFQTGEFKTHDVVANPAIFPAFFDVPPSASQVSEDFQRSTLYAYDTWHAAAPLYLIGGVAFDDVQYPSNFRNPPVAPGASRKTLVSPKAGLIWSPLDWLTARAAYARSIGGVSFDESFRLEPAQVAGFNQSFRSIIPESIAGSVSAPLFDIAGAALDIKLPSNTYLGVEGDYLTSEVEQFVGTFDFSGGAPPPPPIHSSATRQRFEYEERSLSLSINQLLGKQWAVGAGYRWTDSLLDTRFPAIPVAVNPAASTHQRANMNQLRGFVVYHHPSGWFGQAESDWYSQFNAGYTPALDHQEFWLVNVLGGYKLPHRRGEIAVGVLNLMNQNYHLNPLNVYPEFARERSLLVRLKLVL